MSAKLTYTVEEAGALLGVSRSVAYEACRTGDLPSVRIGRRIVVPRQALENMLSGGQPDSGVHGGQLREVK